MAGTSEIKIFRGDSKTFNLTFKDSEGNPKDLTNSVVYFTVKTEPNISDDNASITKKVVDHVDALNGKSQVSLTPEDTDLEPARYHYDFQLVDAANKITTLVVDKFIVKADITRRTS